MFSLPWQPSSRGAHQVPTVAQEPFVSSPIDRLPPEILSAILALVSQDAPRTRTQRFSEYNLASWYGISVLGVSRRWRTIAFTSPEFWSKLPLDSPEWAKTALERSKAVSLVLDTSTDIASGGNRRDVDILKAALQQMSRMREIVIHWSVLTDRSTRDIVLAAIKGRPAPVLERLVIGSLANPGEIPLFLNEPTPRLHYLSLDTFPIPSSSPLLRNNLHTLKLKNCGAVWDSARDMIQALSFMPDLEHLELVNAFPDIVDPTRFPLPAPVTQLKMAALKSLRIEDSCRRVASILQRISIPPECTINIVSRMGDHEPLDSIPQLRSAIKGQLPSTLAFTRVAMADLSSYHLSFDAWLSTPEAPSSRASSDIPAHLTQVFEWSASSSFHSRLSLLAHAGFPIPNASRVQDVKIPAHVLAWNDMLPGFFSALQSAEKVTLFNPFKQNPAEGDMYAFVRRDASPAPLSVFNPHSRIFPACRKLCLNLLSVDGMSVRSRSSATFLDFLKDIVVDISALTETRAEDIVGHWPHDLQALVRQRIMPSRRFVQDSWSPVSNFLTGIGIGNAASTGTQSTALRLPLDAGLHVKSSLQAVYV